MGVEIFQNLREIFTLSNIASRRTPLATTEPEALKVMATQGPTQYFADTEAILIGSGVARMLKFSAGLGLLVGADRLPNGFRKGVVQGFGAALVADSARGVTRSFDAFRVLEKITQSSGDFRQQLSELIQTNQAVPVSEVHTRKTDVYWPVVINTKYYEARKN